MRVGSALALLCPLVLTTPALAWPHEGRAVGPGLIYRHFSGPIEIPGSGTSDQEIFVLYVDTLDPRVRFIGSAEADRGLTVSQFAERRGLAVAMNTSFFDGSRNACGLMAGMGTVWNASYDAGASCADSIGLSPGNEMVVFESDGLRLGPLPPRVSEVATGMPFVVRDGSVVDQAVIESPPNPSHMGTANPRSALCVHGDGRSLVFVVVDGRATGRVGMRGITLGRFLFHNLGCRHGLNLDGGGSSTLFVRGEPGFGGRPAGVVNRTSDGTERAVCCHLGVRIGEPEPLFAAEPIGGGDVMLEPGAESTLAASWRNVGRRAWTPSEPWPVRVGTADPRDRASILRTDAWRGDNRVFDVPGLVAPGELLELSLPVRAPTDPGEYEESFELVAENATWMDGPLRYRVLVGGADPDAGPAPIDAGGAVDAATPRDAGGERDSGHREDSGRREDAGGARGPVTGGCACTTQGVPRSVYAWVLLALVARRPRRLRP